MRGWRSHTHTHICIYTHIHRHQPQWVANIRTRLLLLFFLVLLSVVACFQHTPTQALENKSYSILFKHNSYASIMFSFVFVFVADFCRPTLLAKNHLLSCWFSIGLMCSTTRALEHLHHHNVDSYLVNSFYFYSWMNRNTRNEKNKRKRIHNHN